MSTNFSLRQQIRSAAKNVYDMCKMNHLLLICGTLEEKEESSLYRTLKYCLQASIWELEEINLSHM